MRTRKGQAAFEYMVIIGIALAILLGLVAFSYNWTVSSRDDLAVSSAENSVAKIVDAADLVYSQGYPAKTRVLVQMPYNIQQVKIQNTTITFVLSTRGATTDVFATSKAPLQGNVTAQPGNYFIQVQSFGDYVNVSQST
jgi:uncharacterized protein (UPF0333 family)